MSKLVPIGRIFFALAIIGLGIEHFIYQDFITGRAPAWPESIPGKLVWAYLSGAFFILTGLAIIFRKKARPAAIITGVIIFLWAFLRHIPVIAADSFLSGAWTHTTKALKMFSGAWVIAATLPAVKGKSETSLLKFVNLRSEFILLGRICLGIYLLVPGIQHFLATEFVASLIPVWFPGDAVFWTYFAGVALIASGIGLLIPQTARLAALLSGLMVFSWFWIIHIPRVLPTPLTVSDTKSVFGALATAGIAFVIAEFLYKQKEKEPLKGDKKGDV